MLGGFSGSGPRPAQIGSKLRELPKVCRTLEGEAVGKFKGRDSAS